MIATNHLMKGMKLQMENMTQKFANAVLSRRKQLGLTQEELAKRVGTSKQMVSKYELAQRSPKIVMANKFAEALETTLDELLGVEKADTEFLFEAYHEVDPEIKIVSSMMETMPKEQQEQIVAIVRAIMIQQQLKKGTDK